MRFQGTESEVLRWLAEVASRVSVGTVSRLAILTPPGSVEPQFLVDTALEAGPRPNDGTRDVLKLGFFHDDERRVLLMSLTSAAYAQRELEGLARLGQALKGPFPMGTIMMNAVALNVPTQTMLATSRHENRWICREAPQFRDFQIGQWGDLAVIDRQSQAGFCVLFGLGALPDGQVPVPFRRSKEGGVPLVMNVPRGAKLTRVPRLKGETMGMVVGGGLYLYDAELNSVDEHALSGDEFVFYPLDHLGELAEGPDYIQVRGDQVVHRDVLSALPSGLTTFEETPAQPWM